MFYKNVIEKYFKKSTIEKFKNFIYFKYYANYKFDTFKNNLKTINKKQSFKKKNQCYYVLLIVVLLIKILFFTINYFINITRVPVDIFSKKYFLIRDPIDKIGRAARLPLDPAIYTIFNLCN